MNSDAGAPSPRVQRLLGRRWVRLLAVLGLVGLGLGFAVLESLRFAGSRRGVESVGLPQGSAIAMLSSGADYMDAYRSPLASHVSIETIDRFAFQRGEVVAASPNEVVFQSQAPGLRFLVSYHLTDIEDHQSVTVSTAVFYESLLGLIYFTPVKQVHKRGVPFVVSQMVGNLSGADGD